MLKKVLCFGDSNTYGFNPINGNRYSSNTRWCSLLKDELKSQYEIIEAGCNNRTCFSYNPMGFEQTGYKALTKYLNKDIEYLIIQLGINDLQTIYKNDLLSFEKGLESFIKLIYSTNSEVKILLLSPSKINTCILNSYFSTMFDKKSVELSHELHCIYKKIADLYKCDVINLDEITTTSQIDGIHYEENAHKTIAKAICNYFLNLT